VEEECADALHLENLIGCYRGGDVRSIVVYDVPDERVHDAVLSTVAWGLLMAAWEQVDTFDRAALDLLMQARLDAEPPDSDLAAAVADAAADDPAAARAQAFATVGSRLDEALDPALEAVYARWFSDRVAAVAAGQAPYSLVDATAAELDEAWEAQSALESANAQSRAQLTSDRASLDAAMDRYNEAAAEYNALTPAQRSASTSSWTLWDGTVIPMQPSGDTLAAVREHLVAAPTTFDAREAALAEADAAAAASRADLEAREADLDAMLDALWPDESGDS
ncbi:MAG TPA: hypothetical protein PKB06_05130, partial [Actinotalea sp.]|nr:hypothetical protein [Actinotalea sp.]